MAQEITHYTKVRIGKGKTVWRVSAILTQGRDKGLANLLSTDGSYRARYGVPIETLTALEDQR